MSSVLKAHLLCGEQDIGNRGGNQLKDFCSSPRWLDQTGSREMERSGQRLADGLMWEVRRKNQEGSLEFLA